MKRKRDATRATFAGTGVSGLDDVLAGGFAQRRLFLVEGDPGTGKTTLALSFLREGQKAGEKTLYVTLSETEEELVAAARSHGWSLDGIDIFELMPKEGLFDEQQSLLYSSDLELGESTKRIFQKVDQIQPTRVVVDSLSELRLLAQSVLRYRRQVLALKHYFSQRGATVLLLDDLTTDTPDKTVHSVAHGVIRLEELAPEYGAERRKLRVLKYRGHRFRGGYHDFLIRTGGLEVYPRLISAEHRTPFERSLLTSGIQELDALLGGGIERGSSALILGPSGAGKSLLALQFAVAAMSKGEKTALFVFDEELGLLFDRTRALGMDIEKLRDEGRIAVIQVDTAELTPGGFSARVRSVVDSGAVKTVIIDSLNGYQAAMPAENFLILHIHELLQYLNRQGATTILTVAQHGLVGDMKSPVEVTYLADTVILLRYFEALGHVRRAMSVIKKRAGRHERTIREFEIDCRGISLGDPLADFQGVLQGIPRFTGGRGDLLARDGDGRD